MFDARLRPLIDPPLTAAARWLHRLGLSANMVTLTAALVGLAAGTVIAQQQYLLGLILVAANRLLDGLDGPLARLTQPTALGGYFDSLADYLFYLAVPFGFAFADPGNLVPALLLIASFTLTAVSFLAFAAIAARQDMRDDRHGEKAFTYSSGLMEGGETIFFFLLFCSFPQHFAAIAICFALLCLMTVLQRILIAGKVFR